MKTERSAHPYGTPPSLDPGLSLSNSAPEAHMGGCTLRNPLKRYAAVDSGASGSLPPSAVLRRKSTGAYPMLDNDSFGKSATAMPDTALVHLLGAADTPLVGAADDALEHTPTETETFLGRGQFGSVFKVSATAPVNGGGATPAPPPFARKRITLTSGDPAAMRTLRTELIVARRLQRSSAPHLLRVRNARAGQMDATIDMELLDAGPLSRFAPMRDEACVAAVARELLLGLKALHGEVRALHRDIKLQNILASRAGAVKLVDFGSAAVLPDDAPADAPLVAEDQQGTILQMSPERLRGEPHGPASDVWSVGVTIAELATGKHPFMSAAAADLAGDGGVTGRFWALASVIKHTASADECAAATDAALTQALANSSDVLRDFVRRAVHADPVRRATIAGLLEHPFVARGESDRSNGGGGSHTVPGPWVA
uniref:mitogen-activated protein kinase kinase n=1 Tax=Neobodo designis TaxID=312471 RepID=A0A7S1LGX3_NEODS